MPAEGGGKAKGGKPKVKDAVAVGAAGRDAVAAVERAMVQQGAEAVAGGMPMREVAAQLERMLAGVGLDGRKEAIAAAIRDLAKEKGVEVASGSDSGEGDDDSDAEMEGDDDGEEEEEEEEGESGSGSGEDVQLPPALAAPGRQAQRQRHRPEGVDEAAFARALEQLREEDDDDDVLEALTFFRKLLSREADPPIKRVREAGILRRVAEVLRAHDSLKHRFEAAWLLTNVASGDVSDTAAVVECGGVEAALAYIVPPAEGDEHGDINMEEGDGDGDGGRGRGEKKEMDVSEGELCAQCVWLIGNVAGEARFRDALLAAGAVPAFVRLLQAWIDAKGASKLEWLRSATWASTNLVRGKPPADPAAVRQLLPVYARLVTAADTEVATDASWGLCFLSDLPGMPAEVREAHTMLDGDDVNVLEAVVAVMSRRRRVPSIMAPLLRCLGTLVSDDDAATTSAVLEAGALPVILALTSNAKYAVRKEAWWTLSNIAAGTPEQLATLLAADLAAHALRGIADERREVVKEVLFTVGNALGEGALNPGDDVRDFAVDMLKGGLHKALAKVGHGACGPVARAIVATLLGALDDLDAPSELVRTDWYETLEGAQDDLQDAK